MDRFLLWSFKTYKFVSDMDIDELFEQLDELAQSKKTDLAQTDDILKIYITEEVRKHVKLE